MQELSDSDRPKDAGDRGGESKARQGWHNYVVPVVHEWLDA